MPNTSEPEFLLKYENLLTKLSQEKAELIIGLDQNFDYLNVNNHTNTSKLLDINLNNNLCPTILRPTRITKKSATLIDNLNLSSKLYFNHKSAILLTHISDHLPCYVSISYNAQITENEYYKRNLSAINIEKINNSLLDVNWSVLDDMNCNESYKLLMSKITTVVNEISPAIKFKNKSRVKEPWITDSILKSSRKCDKMYRKVMKLDKSDQRYKTYKLYRNQLNYIKRRQKINFYKYKITSFGRNSRKIWQLIKELTGKSNDKTSMATNFVIYGKPTSDNNIISHEFNKFFSTIGKKYADKIPAGTKSFNEFLPVQNENVIFLQPTDKEEIYKIINNFSMKHSTGPDVLSNSLLKQIAVSIINPLFYRSLQ